MFLIKAGFPTILFVCSGYVKELANNLNNQSNNNKSYKKEKSDLKIYDSDASISPPNSTLLQKTEEKEGDKKKLSLSAFFNTFISLLFIPLPLLLLLQLVSFYLISHIGTTSDVMKQRKYIIFALVEVMSSVSSILPQLL